MVLLSSCRAPPAPPAQSPPDEGPPIVLDGIYVEERRDGRILWSARAPRATGSTQAAAVTELVLHVNEAAHAEAGLSLMAAQAELVPSEGNIVLHDVSGHDTRGLVFTTPTAHFARKAQRLDCPDAIELRAPLGEVRAAQAQLALGRGDVTLMGPVTGRLMPAKRPPAPPPGHAPRAGRAAAAPRP